MLGGIAEKILIQWVQLFTDTSLSVETTFSICHWTSMLEVQCYLLLLLWPTIRNLMASVLHHTYINTANINHPFHPFLLKKLIVFKEEEKDKSFPSNTYEVL